MSNPLGLVWKTELTANDETIQEQQGILRHELDDTNGYKIYKYVQVASDTTVANGTPLLYTIATTSLDDVTYDLDDSKINLIAGVGVGAITASYFGWVQIYGYHSVVITNADDDIAAGDAIIYGAADGVVDSVAAGTAPTNTTLGFAVAADVNDDDTVAVFLDCPH